MIYADTTNAIDSKQVRLLALGELSSEDAAALLVQTGEDSLSLETIKLFVQSISATISDKNARLLERLKTMADLFDCSGTGGSGLPHYNTSTTVAFVLAAAGIPIAKFGNRAANSLSGSFDFLDGLEIGEPASVEKMPELLDKTNLLFLYAPQFYPALGKFAPVRRQLKMPTVLNLIGPLLNPTAPRQRLLGTPKLRGNELIAKFLLNQGHVRRAIVATSERGLDEMEPDGANHLNEIDCGKSVYRLHTLPEPRHLLSPATAVCAGDSVRIFRSLINNDLPDTDYFQQSVCLNAGAALFVARKAANLNQGFHYATQLIRSHAVKEKFDSYRSAYANIVK